MESILVHPENAEQLKTVKAVLKALKVQFEPQSAVTLPHVLEGIQRGFDQAKKGKQYLFKNLNTNIFCINKPLRSFATSA